jgi:hypothetical protein
MTTKQKLTSKEGILSNIFVSEELVASETASCCCKLVIFFEDVALDLRTKTENN